MDNTTYYTANLIIIYFLPTARAFRSMHYLLVFVLLDIPTYFFSTLYLAEIKKRVKFLIKTVIFYFYQWEVFQYSIKIANYTIVYIYIYR